jgi:hypothetical protein
MILTGLHVQIKHLPPPLQNRNVVPITLDKPKLVPFKSRGAQMSICVQQFPLVLLAAITAHKVQGMTLDGVVIDDLVGPGSQKESAYVVR